jgi:hypothetical protein
MPTDASVSFTGGCQCGAIRYELSMRPVKVHFCHCRMCQRAVGNVFAALAPVKRSRIAWSKPPKTFASSSVAERGFCADCGTPLTFAYVKSEWQCVTLGSLDHPELVPIEMHEGVESQLPWLHLPGDLPRNETDAAPVAGMVSHQVPMK